MNFPPEFKKKFERGPFWKFTFSSSTILFGGLSRINQVAKANLSEFIKSALENYWHIIHLLILCKYGQHNNDTTSPSGCVNELDDVLEGSRVGHVLFHIDRKVPTKNSWWILKSDSSTLKSLEMRKWTYTNELHSCFGLSNSSSKKQKCPDWNRDTSIGSDAVSH